MLAVSGMMRDAMIEHNARRRSWTTDIGECGVVHDVREEGGHVVDDDDDADLGLLPRLATSACGSAVASVITSPLDVVRTQRQAMALSGPSSSLLGGGGTMPSSWEVVVGLHRREEARALFDGIVPRMYINCPGMIAMIVGYQYVKELTAGVERWRRTGD